jgi:hypothetical protein
VLKLFVFFVRVSGKHFIKKMTSGLKFYKETLFLVGFQDEIIYCVYISHGSLKRGMETTRLQYYVSGKCEVNAYWLVKTVQTRKSEVRNLTKRNDPQKMFLLPSSKVKMTCPDYILYEKGTRGGRRERHLQASDGGCEVCGTAAEQTHRSLKASLGRGRTSPQVTVSNRTDTNSYILSILAGVSCFIRKHIIVASVV